MRANQKSSKTNKRLWRFKAQICGYRWIIVAALIAVLFQLLMLIIILDYAQISLQGPSPMQHQEEYRHISIDTGFDFVYIDVQMLSPLLDHQTPSRTQSMQYYYEAKSVNNKVFIIGTRKPVDQSFIGTVRKEPVRYEGRAYTLTDEQLERIMDAMSLSSLQSARKRYGYTYLRVGDHPNGSLGQSCFVIFLLPVPIVLVWYFLTKGYNLSMKEIRNAEEIDSLLEDWSMVDRTFEKQGVLLGQHFIFQTSGGIFFRYQDIQDITFGRTPAEKSPNEGLCPISLLRLCLNNRRIIYLGYCSSFDFNKNKILREQIKSIIKDKVTVLRQSERQTAGQGDD